MGGYGSGRWGWGGARQTTDEWLGLDVRTLAHAGALKPGTTTESFWSYTGPPVGSIRIEAREQSVVLDYQTRYRHDPVWVPVREVITVVTTPCRYGGTRPWFRCPGCGARRAILYGGDGRFRCRQCRDLAYRSTREDAIERTHRRLGRLRERFGADPQGRGIPLRPPRMHDRTYARLIREFTANADAMLALAAPRTEALETPVVQAHEREPDE